MNVRLMHGDCLVEMAKIADGSVDLIACDLPYGTTACKWDTVIPFEPLWTHYRRILKPCGAVVLTASQPFTSALVMSNTEWFRYEWIWKKSQTKTPGLAKYRPMPVHENILVFSQDSPIYNPQKWHSVPYYRKAKDRKTQSNELKLGYKKDTERSSDGDRYPLSVLDITEVRQGRLHPTQKPVALFEYLIRTYSNEGETVLDNTMGSGTTGVACVNTERNFIGIEQVAPPGEVDYFPVAERRIAEALDSIPLFRP